MIVDEEYIINKLNENRNIRIEGFTDYENGSFELLPTVRQRRDFIIRKAFRKHWGLNKVNDTLVFCGLNKLYPRTVRECIACYCFEFNESNPGNMYTYYEYDKLCRKVNTDVLSFQKISVVPLLPEGDKNITYGTLKKFVSKYASSFTTESINDINAKTKEIQDEVEKINYNVLHSREEAEKKLFEIIELKEKEFSCISESTRYFFIKGTVIIIEAQIAEFVSLLCSYTTQRDDSIPHGYQKYPFSLGQDYIGRNINADLKKKDKYGAKTQFCNCFVLKGRIHCAGFQKISKDCYLSQITNYTPIQRGDREYINDLQRLTNEAFEDCQIDLQVLNNIVFGHEDNAVSFFNKFFNPARDGESEQEEEKREKKSIGKHKLFRNALFGCTTGRNPHIYNISKDELERLLISARIISSYTMNNRKDSIPNVYGKLNSLSVTEINEIYTRCGFSQGYGNSLLDRYCECLVADEEVRYSPDEYLRIKRLFEQDYVQENTIPDNMQLTLNKAQI